jgi:hypothetical protein
MESSLPVVDKTKVYRQNLFFQEMRAGFDETCEGVKEMEGRVSTKLVIGYIRPQESEYFC